MTRDEAILFGMAGSRTDEVTGALVDLVVGTVLSTAYGNTEAPMSIEFSPEDMNEMHKRYSVTRQHMSGGRTRFVVMPRATPEHSLRVNNDPEINRVPFAEQAKPKPHDRPVWAVRCGTELTFRGHDNLEFKGESDAGFFGRDMMNADDTLVVTIENRMCRHRTCPAEKCNQEATSG